MIILELDRPIGPQQLTRLELRSELVAEDVPAILACMNNDAPDEARLAIRLGSRLCGRPEVEVRELDGDAANALTLFCYRLAMHALQSGAQLSAAASESREICGCTVRSPRLGELAQAEREGSNGEIELVAACVGLDGDHLRQRSAGEYLALRRAVLAAKKGAQKKTKAMAETLAHLLDKNAKP